MLSDTLIPVRHLVKTVQLPTQGGEKDHRWKVGNLATLVTVTYLCPGAHCSLFYEYCENDQYNISNSSALR